MKWIVIVIGGLVALVALVAIGGALLPRDHRATSTVTLRQTPDSVWQVVRDLGSIPGWWTEITVSERLADRDGREAWRQKMSGWDVPLVILESDPPRRLVTKIDSGENASFGGTWTYELTSVPEGTQVRITEDGWVSNPIFRFLSRFVFGYYGSLDGYLKALGKRFGEEVEPVRS